MNIHTVFKRVLYTVLLLVVAQFTASAATYMFAGNWGTGGTTTIGYYTPATGMFYLLHENAERAPVTAFQFGAAGGHYVPIVGDWDANGSMTIGLYDTTDGTVFERNSNSAGNADNLFRYGSGGWQIVTGDWNADHTTTVGLYEAGPSLLWLRNSNSNGPNDVPEYQYGPANAPIPWVPIVGHWSNTQLGTSVSLYDPNTGTFHLHFENNSGPADITFQFGPTAAQRGSKLAWIPIVGDWTGSGLTQVGLYNPNNNNIYLRYAYTSGPADLVFNPFVPEVSPQYLTLGGLALISGIAMLRRRIKAPRKTDQA